MNRFNRRNGSAAIMGIMVLTFLTISCLSIQERIANYGKSEWIDLKSENLLRKAEGTMIITEEKIVEATQRLYDISPYKEDFKGRIESFEYRKQYISEIENLSDVNIEDVKIDVDRDDIAEDGPCLYKFWVYVTAFEKEYNMKRSLALCVTMKNLRKDRPIPEIKPEEEIKPEGDILENEDIVENINARDALIFRVVRE